MDWVATSTLVFPADAGHVDEPHGVAGHVFQMQRQRRGRTRRTRLLSRRLQRDELRRGRARCGVWITLGGAAEPYEAAAARAIPVSVANNG
jgi:hypothetical protein